MTESGQHPLSRRNVLKFGLAGAASLVPLSGVVGSVLADDTPTASPTPAETEPPEPEQTPVPEAPPVYRAVIPGLASDGPPPPPDPRYPVPLVFYQGDRGRPAVYLTIDDCYSIHEVGRAMDVAEAGGARLTFFPVGPAVQDAPAFWRSVVARGHAVEDHTWDHPRLSRLTTDQIAAQIKSQADAVEAAVGSGYRPKFMRPPYGDGIFNYDPRLAVAATKAGMKISMWSADSNGWRVHPRTDQGAIDYTLGNVFANFYPGSIVLQHALAVDILALPTIIAEATRYGWECITLRDGLV